MDVVAVDPDAALRERIPAPAEVLAGTAEAIPLPDGSVDAVFVGQAFHWFDRDRALPEMRRVLRPDGRVGLLWNLFDDAVAWVAAVADLLQLEDRVRLMRQPAETAELAGFTAHETRSVPNHVPTDADRFEANLRSRSVVSLRPAEEQDDLMRQVRALLPPDPFELPYVCAARTAVRA
ncbi:MAG: hypothetical protein QOF76_5228 [Solirubrobacteraceae bacterium]|jgi:SAM-dependent methyltransferase|nr:hypothetical protein [Solirubrobacteraceae bacterium]